MNDQSSDKVGASVKARARVTLGTSSDAVYRTVSRIMHSRGAAGGMCLDVGCGTGAMREHLRGQVDEYVGADLVRYERFPADCAFRAVNLDLTPWPIEDGFADVTISAETIEHLENPRAFVRELVRVTRPGGLVVLTTPNQLSLLSKLTLVVKNQFNAFQASCYPAHLTALLEVDLRRIAAECALADVAVDYTAHGRIAFCPHHYPRAVSRWFPRALSDNVALSGRRRRPG